jgi:hypothetical protein
MVRFLAAALLAAPLGLFSTPYAAAQTVDTGIASSDVAGFSAIDGTFRIDFRRPVRFDNPDEFGRPDFQFDVYIDTQDPHPFNRAVKCRFRVAPCTGTTQTISFEGGVRSTVVAPGGDGSEVWQPVQGWHLTGLSFTMPVSNEPFFFTFETFRNGGLEDSLDGRSGISYVNTVPEVPEPAHAALLLAGLGMLLAARGRGLPGRNEYSSTSDRLKTEGPQYNTRTASTLRGRFSTEVSPTRFEPT